MKHLPSLLILVTGLMVSHAARAQVALGTEVATFPLTVSKLVADPVRPRIYAADTFSNSVAVIDTTTLAIIANIPVGPDPVDMSVSLDGTALYVASSGSTALDQKIRPNKASATIHIIPLGDPATASAKTLRLTLQPSLDYQLGDPLKAKVKIFFNGQAGPGPL